MTWMPGSRIASLTQGHGLGFTLWDGDELLFSSNFNAIMGQTDEQGIAAGNIQVRSDSSNNANPASLEDDELAALDGAERTAAGLAWPGAAQADISENLPNLLRFLAQKTTWRRT